MLGGFATAVTLGMARTASTRPRAVAGAEDFAIFDLDGGLFRGVAVGAGTSRPACSAVCKVLAILAHALASLDLGRRQCRSN